MSPKNRKNNLQTYIWGQGILYQPKGDVARHIVEGKKQKIKCWHISNEPYQ